MTTCPEEGPTGAGASRIRLSVWLLVLVLGLVMLVVICLPRPSAVQAPEAPTQPQRVIAEDKPSPVRVDLLSRARQVVPESEPMQKTVDGWILDLGSTNNQVVIAALNAFGRLGPDATSAIPQLAQMVKEGRLIAEAPFQFFKLDGTEVWDLDPELFQSQLPSAIRWFSSRSADDFAKLLSIAEIPVIQPHTLLGRLLGRQPSGYDFTTKTLTIATDGAARSDSVGHHLHGYSWVRDVPWKDE